MSTARCFFLETAFSFGFPMVSSRKRLSLGDHFPEGNEEEEANDSQLPSWKLTVRT